MNLTPDLALPDSASHWPSMARAWQRAGSPLRPSPEDVAGYTRAIQDWIDLHGAPRVLLLGVTPEIYRLPWPAGHDLLAVDHTPADDRNIAGIAGDHQRFHCRLAKLNLRPIVSMVRRAK